MSLVTLVFWLLVIGFIGLVVVRVFMIDKHSEDSVIQRWSTLLIGQGNLGEEFFDKVSKELKGKNLPYPHYRERISTSLTSGKLHDFVAIRMNNDCSSFISAVPQGHDLCVTWLLQDHMIRGIYKTPIIGPMLIAVLKRYTFAMTNDVTAFATATHDAAVQATESIMDEKMLDKSHLNRKSSGKLGPL
jgi:hypothetical protein